VFSGYERQEWQPIKLRDWRFKEVKLSIEQLSI
jgi:hypothetical protein